MRKADVKERVFLLHRWLLLSSFLTFMVTGCGRDSKVDERPVLLTEVRKTLEDSTTRVILKHKDRLEPDSLVPYFKHSDPTYRYWSALSFASIKDNIALDSLEQLLKDPIREVRKAVAFALGQIGDQQSESALITAFQEQEDSIDPNNDLNNIMLEAIGKCGSSSSLTLLSQVTTYLDTDHHLLLGQARAIFRFMLRGIVNENGTQRMVQLLADPDLPENIRMIACQYLARADITLKDHAEVLSLTFSNLDSSDLKNSMPLVLAKCQSRETNDLLQKCIEVNQDFRLKCNALRAMGRTNFNTFRNTIQKALYDRNIAVSSTAAEMLLQYGSAEYWRTYLNLSLSNFPWQVKITLLHAVSRHIPPGNDMFNNMNDDFLRQRINSTSNNYEKAAGILAFAEEPGHASFIINLKNSSKDPVIRTACIQGLKNIVNSSKFKRISASAQKEMIDQLVQALESGDVGMVEQAAFILDIDLSKYGYEVKTLIDRAESQLQIPRDMEALIPLHRKLAELQGEAYDHRVDLKFTHSIDWSILDMAGTHPHAVIETNKGSFTVALYPEEAPATVANFIDLVNLNYYAGKAIHRSVPGFVIQGGCNRGDGYGSLDYHIRSEFPILYFDGPGYLGMASAGNHTESAQWFVTQGATPHLDGNYTLFGKVVDGMKVVNSLVVGDIIQKINML